MKKLFITALVVSFIVVIMIPIGHLLFPENEVNPLTIPRYELNDLSLNDIFVTNEQKLDVQLLPNPDFTLNYNGWTLTNATASVSNGILSLIATAQNGKISTTYMHDGSTYYINSRLKTSRSNSINLTAFGLTSSYHSGSNDYENLSVLGVAGVNYSIAINDVASSGWTTSYVDYVYLINVSYLISRQQYSPYYNTTFDLLTNTQRQYQLDLWVQEGVDNINIWLTYNSVGLDSILSEDQMLYWYNEYLSYVS